MTQVNTADFNDWVARVGAWRDATSAVPLLVRDEIVKSKLDPGKPKGGPRSLMFDPLSIQFAMGYKDRRYSLTYDVLKRIPQQLSLIAAIIQTRCNQVASFAVPFRLSKSLGFAIRHKNPARMTTKGEREFIQSVETFIYNCGAAKPNPHSPVPRDDFETFLKKIVRDSLMYDQACHPAGTLVTLADGTTVPIEDVEAGHMVVSHDGRAHPVVHPTQRLFSGDLISITGRGVTVTATEGHQFFVLKNEWAHLSQYAGTHVPEWLPATAIKPGMYLTRPIPQLPETETESPFGSLTPELAFVLGLYVAEGNCIPTEVRFTFHEEETNLASAVYRQFESDTTKVRGIEYDDRAAICVRVVSRRLSSLFTEHFGTGSANKRIPAWLMTSSKPIKESFLAGYLSGDGCLRVNRASFTTTSRTLYDQLSLLFNSCGIYTSLVERDFSSHGWSQQFLANLSGKNYRAFAARTGLPVDVSVSFREPVLSDDAFFYIRVNDVSRRSVVDFPVYNMEVADTHSYIADGYTSHNCFEIVPDRRGLPYEFLAVDASTIRLAANNIDLDYATAMRHNIAYQMGQWPQSATPNAMFTGAGPFRTLQVKNPELEDVPSYIQLVNGIVRNTYTRGELAFGVRNPRSDIYIQGYGYSELEQLITIITAHLFAEEYNRRFFMQGSAPKGILNFKGDNFTPDQLEAFKRQWRSNLEGVENSWRTPIMQAEQGVEWIDLHPSNQEMEYSMWIEYLIKITCAVFLIDPAELNFDMHGGVQQTPLFESSQEWKLKASRDRGLKPMLRFIAKLINDQIVNKLDDHFTFDFLGLDELTEQEKLEVNKEKLATYMTLNEIRRADDLSDVEDGDIVMNPTYTTYLQQKRQSEMQEKQMAAASGAGGAAGGAGGAPGEQQQGAGGEETQSEGPQYADGFTKSVGNTKVLEISLDDESWIDVYRGGG